MWIDISRPLEPGALTHPEDPPPLFHRYSSMDAGADYNLTQLTMSLHTGTHFDAPLHFVRDGASIDALPLSRFMCRAHVLELGDALCLTPAHLDTLALQPGDAVLIRTSNELLPRERMAERWVYVSADAARWCDAHGVGILGVDYIELEDPNSSHGSPHASYPVHETLLPAGVLLLENLDLRGVSAGLYELLCLPLRITGAEASPCRAVIRRL